MHTVPRLRLLLAVALCLGLVPRPAAAADKVDADAVSAIVEASRKEWDVPGACLAIVRDDEVVFLKGFGVRELGSDRPVTPDTLFAIASCTKAFTATALATLVDEGKASWDDPVRKHLPEFHLADPLADRKVTLRDLLCHRTGLARGDILWINSPWGRDELIRRLAYLEPEKPFRSTFLYNNIAYSAAGQAAAAAGKTTWEDLVQKRLFEPLGMKTANTSREAVLRAEDHASPHHRNRKGKVEVMDWRDLDNVLPAGGINASGREMAAWVRFQLGDGTWDGKRLVSAENLRETHAPQIVVRLDEAEKALNPDTTQKSYGLGWFIQDYHGRLVVSHTGGLEGFRSRVVLVPKAKLGIVLLTNSGAGASQAAMHVAATTNLLDLLLGLKARDWDGACHEFVAAQEEKQQKEKADREARRRKGTRPSRELAAYAGVYEDPGYGAVTIVADRDGLRFEWSNFKHPLEHWHYDTFVVRGNEFFVSDEVVFTLDGDGEVASLRFLNVEFKKTRKGK
jgi:CubicO group peptidase (beta-lactamase class C family)